MNHVLAHQHIRQLCKTPEDVGTITHTPHLLTLLHLLKTGLAIVLPDSLIVHVNVQIQVPIHLALTHTLAVEIGPVVVLIGNPSASS